MAGPPEPGVGSVRVGVMFAAPWPMRLLIATAAAIAAVGTRVSILIGTLRYCVNGCTAVAAAWPCCSGDVQRDVRRRRGRAGDGIVAIRTVSRVPPLGSSTSSSPTARPVVLVRRMAVAPAAAAWLRPPLITPPGVPRATLPAASMARTRTLLAPSAVNGGGEPPVDRQFDLVGAVVDRVLQARATPTLSVADTLERDARCVYQFLLPVDDRRRHDAVRPGHRRAGRAPTACWKPSRR